MRSVIAVSCLLAAAAVGPAAASDCPGKPDALGVSRTIVVDPSEHRLLGSFSYRESLPLEDHEVVLTFDDGPLPPYTMRILETLASECVKATFFMVGRMAQAYPKLVQRVYAEGHTIANHSQNHPFTFHKMTVDHAAFEIEHGFASIGTALGKPEAVAPFFRFPGLLHQPPVERYLAAHDVMAWSVDIVADDWTHISGKEVVRRAINRLEARGKGILLLHDIQPATAAGLPELLAELKSRGFKIVHVVPTGPGRVKTATLPEQWAVRHTSRSPDFWPEPPPASLVPAETVLAVPSPRSFGVVEMPRFVVPVTFASGADPAATAQAEAPPAPISLWPHSVTLSVADTEVLPAPAEETFRYSRVWRPRASRSVSRPGPRSMRKLAVRKDAVGMIGTTPVPPHAIPTATRRTTDIRTRHSAGHKHSPGKLIDPAQPTGHQIQLPNPVAPVPKPAAQNIKPTAGLLETIFR